MLKEKIMSSEGGIGTSSGNLIDKYNKRRNILHQGTPLLSKNDATVKSVSDKNHKETYYSQNSFKRYMGYKEPDYLMVAGLYASMETSNKSKVYGNFLVRGADYAAEALGWHTKDGKPDIKRATRAIRTACRTKAPNGSGLFFMYSKSNKDRYLSDKGGSRLYMSGRRYQELVNESIYLKNKYSSLANQMDISELVPPQITQDYQRIKYMLKEVAERHGIIAFDEKAIDWMTDRFIQEMDMKSIEHYCDLITSDWYYDQLVNDRYCPKLSNIFHIYYKYQNIMNYVERCQK